MNQRRSGLLTLPYEFETLGDVLSKKVRHNNLLYRDSLISPKYFGLRFENSRRLRHKNMIF